MDDNRLGKTAKNGKTDHPDGLEQLVRDIDITGALDETQEHFSSNKKKKKKKKKKKTLDWQFFPPSGNG